MGQMTNDGNRFVMFLTIMVTVAITTASQYLLVEINWMKPNDKRTAALVNMMLLASSALFNGFIIQLGDLPVYLQWVPFLMLSYWGFVATLINDIGGFGLECNGSVLECATKTGDTVVKQLKYDDRDVFMCLFVLLVMTFVYMLSGVLVFYFKYVRNYGAGLKREESKEIKQAQKEWYEYCKQYQEEQAGEVGEGEMEMKDGILSPKNIKKQISTIDAVLTSGTPKIKRQTSQATLQRKTSALNTNGMLQRQTSNPQNTLGSQNSNPFQRVHDVECGSRAGQRKRRACLTRN